MMRIDPVTAEVLKINDNRRTGGQRIMGLVYPVHAGQFGGLTVRVVYALVGLVPAALFVTGALLWWWKRKRRRVKKAAAEPVRRAEAVGV